MSRSRETEDTVRMRLTSSREYSLAKVEKVASF